MKTWRRHWLDVALVLLATAIASGALSNALTRTALASLLVSVVAMLVFLARRWRPFAVSLLAFGFLAFGASFEHEIGAAQFFGILVTFGLVGALNRPRDAVVLWLAGELTVAYAVSHEASGARLSDFALTSAFCTTIWAAGLAVAERGRHAVAAEARARTAEQATEEKTRQARERERARIATELHDIVSHGLSVVVVQTVAARQSLADEGLTGVSAVTDADRRMAAVEDTARDALADMRRMLGLLQSTTDVHDGSDHTGSSAVDDIEPIDATAATGPSPGIDSLPRLLDRVRASGVPTTTSGFESLPPVPAALSLTVYRIVQESLTNVIKHAPGASATVDVGLRAGAVHVTITNSAGRVVDPRLRPSGSSPVGAGRGLIGLHQRVEVYGGTFRTEPLADGGFRVEVALPHDAGQVGVPGREQIEHAG